MKILKVVFIILFLPISLYPQKSVKFLFDQSGSMTDYYVNRSSMFKTFAKALIKNTTEENDNVTISLFSKKDTKRNIISPTKIYQGSKANLIFDKIMGEFKTVVGNDKDYGTTDLIEALNNAIEQVSGTEIIWLITDNVNDNAGSGDSSYSNTLEFYQFLRNNEKIQKILLFPIPERIQGENFESTGYVCYAIVYSEKKLSQQELEEYHTLLLSSGIKQKPITLKPLDIGTITLSPKKTLAKISEGKLYFDGKMLRGFGFEEGEKINEVFPDLALKSNLFPYIIKSAKLSVRLDNFSSSDYSVKSLGTQTINPSSVSNVSSEGEVQGFSVTFNMPEISPNFSLGTIFREDFTVGGSLILEVSQVDILLDEVYMNNFKDVFALKTVPEIFKPVLKDKKIETKIPLEIRIKYGIWRLLVLIGLAAVLILIFIAMLYYIFKKSSYEITINNTEKQTLSISFVSPADFSYGYSPVLGKVKKGITGTVAFKYSSHTTSPGKVTGIIEGVPIEIEYTDIRNEIISIIFKKTNKTGKVSESSPESETEKFH